MGEKQSGREMNDGSRGERESLQTVSRAESTNPTLWMSIINHLSVPRFRPLTPANGGHPAAKGRNEQN